MPKLIICKNLQPHQLERIQAAAPDWHIIADRDETTWLPHLMEADVFGGWHERVRDCLVAPTSALRWLHDWSAGVDKLPLQQFRERGIFLTNASGVHAYPISETVLGMMLTLTRRLHAYIRNQQTAHWHHANISLEMHGKTVGILGLGAIGWETAKLCKAFGMRTLGLRRSAAMTPVVDELYSRAALPKLLAESDYVINTLPLTDATRHMIGSAELRSMKPTAFYINIGRGGTTDEAALVEALRTGQIAGAGLDVFEQEPLPTDSPLWHLENVIVTPHSAGSTEHYYDRVLDVFVPNLRAFVAGGEPTLNRIDFNLQY